MYCSIVARAASLPWGANSGRRVPETTLAASLGREFGQSLLICTSVRVRIVRAMSESRTFPPVKAPQVEHSRYSPRQRINHCIGDAGRGTSVH